MPAADSPFCSRISASASAVPDDAYAACQFAAVEFAGDGLDLGARGSLGRDECRLRQRAVGEKSLGDAHAAELQRLEPLGHEAAADDELRRAAADVDDEPRGVAGRQHVRDAVVDEPGLLVAGDDVDGEAERTLGLRQERRGVPRFAKRVGGHRAHRRRMQSLDPLAEAGETGDGRAPRVSGEPAARIEARADAQRLAPGVEPVDLVAFDAPHLEPEAVRTHVDDGERGGSECGRGHRGVERNRIRAAFRRGSAAPRTAPVSAPAAFLLTLADRVCDNSGCRCPCPSITCRRS